MTPAATSSGGDPNRDKRASTNPNRGFLERLSDTLGGTLAGVGVFLFSFLILFTNEGRYVRTASSLDEGLSQVTSLHPSSPPDQQYHTRLVHVCAQLSTSQPLHDPNYKVVVQAVKLKRFVEMYQWVEYEHSSESKENGETKTERTYTYNTEWKSELVSSRHFDEEIGHQNPSAMAVESVTVVAPEVRVGPFSLSEGLVEQIDHFQTLSLRGFPASDLDSFLTIDGDYFYHTNKTRRPEVGDVRVMFSFAGLSAETPELGPAQTVSVVAQQMWESLGPFKTKSGDTLEILYQEELSAEEIFSREHNSNYMKTWVLRFVGWLLMFLGVQMMTRIIYTLVDWVPVLRQLVSVGLKIFAICVSLSLSLLTIAAGWVFYRPVVAVGLVLLAVLVMLINRSQVPSKKDQ